MKILDFAPYYKMTKFTKDEFEFIREVMKAKGIDYYQLADMCKLKANKTARNVYAKLYGHRLLTLDQARDIMEALKFTYNQKKKWLFYWEHKLGFMELDRLGLPTRVVRAWLSKEYAKRNQSNNS